MATTPFPDTAREPRIALGVVLERTRPGLATIADVAAGLNVLTALIGDEDDAPPLDVPDAHVSPIWALAVVEHEGAPLIISADDDGALRSWRPDGSPGELQVLDAHTAAIRALAVGEHEGAPLIISAGADGALRSWRLTGALAALERSTASAIEVRELSLDSLQIVVQLPADVLAAIGVAATGITVAKLTTILEAIKRVAGFPAELRLQHTQKQAEQLRAQADVLEAQDQLAEARARYRRRQLQAAGWQVERVVITDDEDDVL